MKILNTLENKNDYGVTTLGEWKDLFDSLVKEYGRDVKFDFVHDSSGYPVGIINMKTENWEFERYCEDTDDYIEVDEKYIRIFLKKLV